MPKNLSTQEQLQKILEEAEKYGLESNFLFRPTLKNFIQQLEYIDALEKIIDEEGLSTENVYIKDRATKAIHPALTMHNKTVLAANQTIATLMKIIKELRTKEKSGEPDPLLEFISGRRKTID
jgi:predicted transcriptional regulator